LLLDTNNDIEVKTSSIDKADLYHINVLARATGGIYRNATIALTVEPTSALMNNAPDFEVANPAVIVIKIQNFTDKVTYESPKIVDEESNKIKIEYQDENDLKWLKFTSYNDYFEL